MRTSYDQAEIIGVSRERRITTSIENKQARSLPKRIDVSLS